MKKFFGFLFIVCLVTMLVVTPIGVAAEGNDVDIDMSEFTPGDINNDHAINLKDLVTIAQVQARWSNVKYNRKALDTNSDSAFTLDDVTWLAKFLVGWEIALNDNAFNG